MIKPDADPPHNSGYVYRAWITLRSGRRIYARHYGLAAFKIPIRHNHGN